MFHLAVEQHQLVALGMEGEIGVLQRAAVEAHQAVLLAEHAGKLVHDTAVHAAVVMLGALTDLGQLKLVDLVVVKQVIQGKREARLEGSR